MTDFTPHHPHGHVTRDGRKARERYDAGADYAETADQLIEDGFSIEMAEGIARACVNITIERRRIEVEEGQGLEGDSK